MVRSRSINSEVKIHCGPRRGVIGHERRLRGELVAMAILRYAKIDLGGGFGGWLPPGRRVEIIARHLPLIVSIADFPHGFRQDSMKRFGATLETDEYVVLVCERPNAGAQMLHIGSRLLMKGVLIHVARICGAQRPKTDETEHRDPDRGNRDQRDPTEPYDGTGLPSLAEQKRKEACQPNPSDYRSNEKPYDDDEERAHDLAI